MTSDSVTWTFHEELFSFLFKTWDVDAAKAIILGAPREIERVPVSTLEPFLSKQIKTETGTRIRAGILTSPDRVANDERIDLEIPIIVATTVTGGIPIDGWHRVAKAVALGVEWLPVVYLTETESERVRLRVAT
jgi:hypothetical protein